MKKIYFFLIVLLSTQFIFAQTATDGGIRLAARVIQLETSVDMEGGGGAGEELTWIGGVWVEGATSINGTTCMAFNDDGPLILNAGNTVAGTFPFVVFDENYTCAVNVPQTIEVYVEGWEDDAGNRCDFDAGDDFHAGPALSFPFDPRTVTAEGVWGGATTYTLGNFSITYEFFWERLNRAIEITDVRYVCNGFGNSATIDVEVDYITATDNPNIPTYNITASQANTGDNPNTATSGTMLFNGHAAGTNFSLVVDYPDGTGSTCFNGASQNNLKCVACPQISTVALPTPLNGCESNNVSVTATLVYPDLSAYDGIQGVDYGLEWWRSVDGGAFTEIITTRGADGILGNADDNNVPLTFTENLGAVAGAACDESNVQYQARVNCLTTVQASFDASTTVPASIIPYDTDASNVVSLDLSAVNGASVTNDIDYSITGTTGTGLNGTTYGISWSCEATITVNTPSGPQGPFCDPTDACWTNPVCNAVPDGTNGDWGFAGTFGGLVGSNAAGIWSIDFSDVFNDAGIDGEIQTASLIVSYVLFNSGANPNTQVTSLGSTNVYKDIDLGTDYTVDNGCGHGATIICVAPNEGMQAMYAAAAAGPYNAGSPVANADGATVFYEISHVDGNAPAACATQRSSYVIDCAILPVEFLSIDANAVDAVNHLEWITASEKNTSHFEVLKSVDGINFNVIATDIRANGNSSSKIDYSFDDKNIQNGTVYYQVRSVDFDGHMDETRIVSVTREGNGTKLEIAVRPIPTQRELMIEFNSTASSIDVKIFDMIGQVVIVDMTTVGTGKIQANVESLAKGAYFVVVNDGTSTEQVRFIKE